MASSTSKMMSVFLVLSLILPNTLAAVYKVGGDKGWAIGTDLKLWLQLNPNIRAGDTLYFSFTSPQTVAVVDLSGFLTCDASKATINDVSGSFYFRIPAIGIYHFISAGLGDCIKGLCLELAIAL